MEKKISMMLTFFNDVEQEELKYMGDADGSNVGIIWLGKNDL